MLAVDRRELQRDVVRRLPALVGIGRKARAHEAIERRRRERPHRRAEGARAGRHLVDHRAERVDVAARVGGTAFELLRRHVVHRPGERAALGQRRRRGDRCNAGCGRTERYGWFRESEVEQLQTGLRDHHVRRFQIAMHDRLTMGLVERVGHLHGVANRLVGRQRSLQQAVRERLAFQVFHDEVLGPVMLSDVIERADVRVRQLRDGLRLALETLPRVGRRGDLGR